MQNVHMPMRICAVYPSTASLHIVEHYANVDSSQEACHPLGQGLTNSHAAKWCKVVLAVDLSQVQCRDASASKPGGPEGIIGWSYYAAGAVCGIGLGLTKLWRS